MDTIVCRKLLRMARWQRKPSSVTLGVYKPWDMVRTAFAGTDIDKAGEAYHNQSAVKALAGTREFSWDHEDVMEPDREKFLQAARDSAIATFAVLMDGTWYEKGEMGWWGIVSNEQDRDEWLSQFGKLLDSLPDDTLLSVYDCHI